LLFLEQRTNRPLKKGFVTPARPPWMAEVLGAKPSVNEAFFTGQTQEQFPVRPPWMAEVLETQEQFPVKAGVQKLTSMLLSASWIPAFAGMTELGVLIFQ